MPFHPSLVSGTLQLTCSELLLEEVEEVLTLCFLSHCQSKLNADVYVAMKKLWLY